MAISLCAAGFKLIVAYYHVVMLDKLANVEKSYCSEASK